MSELRLGGHPSSAFLERFESAPLRIDADDAIAEIEVGEHQFEVALPSDGRTVRAELLAVAREVLAQIVDLDAIAMREVDGTEQDGALFVLDILSVDEVDLRYSAAAWNSDWCEMFRRGADGGWAHHGVRTYTAAS
ncbi:hypothetical protein [Caulobacter sp. 17J65-9]|uniref:hypothetical protein n=1 Tax=Caulobacter sp. 17J65-9 TaxID=2709382 RepID=UPI0013C7495E|nr:hypothetical protein [Caulobacter sp. 17J65-9]NEX93809.1 hypothetical protein [Caulobacter sp. 17J65-9]